MPKAWTWLLVAGVVFLQSMCESLASPRLTAAQIVDKNVQARGGLEAWHKIHSMVWAGHINTRHAAVSRLPFVMEMKKPGKTRFEVQVQGQVSTRLYNGSKGWKMRPARGGVPELQPYTKYELQFARDSGGIGGLLVDYAKKGVTIKLEGTEKIEGRSVYRLNLTLASGSTRRVWIDAKSFLTLKLERHARNRFGMTGIVSVYFSNYKSYHNIKLPMTIESGSDKSKQRDKMVIDRVVINPRLPDWVFNKPLLPPRQPVVSIGGQQSPLMRRLH